LLVEIMAAIQWIPGIAIVIPQLYSPQVGCWQL
jgi:hypothetical protein